MSNFPLMHPRQLMMKSSDVSVIQIDIQQQQQKDNLSIHFP